MWFQDFAFTLNDDVPIGAAEWKRMSEEEKAPWQKRFLYESKLYAARKPPAPVLKPKPAVAKAKPSVAKAAAKSSVAKKSKVGVKDIRTRFITLGSVLCECNEA